MKYIISILFVISFVFISSCQDNVIEYNNMNYTLVDSIVYPDGEKDYIIREKPPKVLTPEELNKEKYKEKYIIIAIVLLFAGLILLMTEL